MSDKFPHGWKMVPIEPTPEMLKASRHSTSKAKTIEACDRAVYAAMLAAAPTAPLPNGTRGGAA